MTIEKFLAYIFIPIILLAAVISSFVIKDAGFVLISLIGFFAYLFILEDSVNKSS